MTKSEAIQLIQGNFGKTLLENVMNYVTTVSWGEFTDGNYDLASNGSCFFLNLGKATILVTASHVYEGYLHAKRLKPNIKSAIGSLPFDLEARLIENLGSKVLDIATFKISDSEVKSLGKHICYGAASWPPATVSKNQGIIFGGYPGSERQKNGAQEYSFGLYVALTPVSSSSERQFGCAFDRDNWLDTFGKGLPPERFDLGGISGGPAFLFKESDNKIITWDLVGVVCDGANEIGEIVFFHHAKFIQPDGRLISI
jgi:hypothetical protein